MVTGFANYSLYVTVAADGIVRDTTFGSLVTRRQQVGSLRWPEPDTTFSSTASVSTVANSDPFGVPNSAHVTDNNSCNRKPGSSTADTIADTNIVLRDFGKYVSEADQCL